MILNKLSLLSDDYKEKFRYTIIKNKWEENLKSENMFELRNIGQKLVQGLT